MARETDLLPAETLIPLPWGCGLTAGDANRITRKASSVIGASNRAAPPGGDGRQKDA